jgi:hypothetical protein
LYALKDSWFSITPSEIGGPSLHIEKCTEEPETAL